MTGIKHTPARRIISWAAKKRQCGRSRKKQHFENWPIVRARPVGKHTEGQYRCLLTTGIVTSPQWTFIRTGRLTAGVSLESGLVSRETSVEVGSPCTEGGSESFCLQLRIHRRARGAVDTDVCQHCSGGGVHRSGSQSRDEKPARHASSDTEERERSGMRSWVSLTRRHTERTRLERSTFLETVYRFFALQGMHSS